MFLKTKGHLASCSKDGQYFENFTFFLPTLLCPTMQYMFGKDYVMEGGVLNKTKQRYEIFYYIDFIFCRHDISGYLGTPKKG